VWSWNENDEWNQKVTKQITPYKNSDADLVPNIVGFNGNPVQMI